MLPVYVDFWCQTAPAPEPNPDVALFLHGPRRGKPDVQVCWRADLIENKHGDWCDIVALLPPTAAECMSVPIARLISRLRHWLSRWEEDEDRNEGSSSDCDLLEVAQEEAEAKERAIPPKKIGVLWRGAKESRLICSPDDLRPGDTLVLPVNGRRRWEELGHIPELPRPSEPPRETDSREIDVAEAAFQAATGKAALRLYPERFSSLRSIPEIKDLVERIEDPEDRPNLTELRALLDAATRALPDDQAGLRERLNALAKHQGALLQEDYPKGLGLVLRTRGRIATDTTGFEFLPALDDGEDDASRIGRKASVSLDDHTDHVAEAMERALSLLAMDDVAEAFRRAARLHDWGKADDRFQAMLQRASRTDAWLSPDQTAPLLAKSDGVPQTSHQRREARQRPAFPRASATRCSRSSWPNCAGDMPADTAERELILHLIAAHHGYGRPFAPVVRDDEPPAVECEGVALSADQRRERPPHRFDSGIAERFWSLTRRFGWWGLAYLEALLRLADQQASANEDAGKYENVPQDSGEPKE